MDYSHAHVWHSHSEAETVRLGEQFGRHYVKRGTVVSVRGELGAGKTHFIKGIARALGIDERALTSPTFALAHEFEVPAAAMHGQTNPERLFHLDCYRFERPKELLELGIEDYLYPQQAATIIEWPERIEAYLPATAVDVEIRPTSETSRELLIRESEKA